MYLGAAAQVFVQRYISVSSKPCLIFKSCSSGSSSWEEGERGRRQREGERRWAGTGWISWSSSPLLRWLIIMMMTIAIFKMSNTLNGSNEPWWPWLGSTRGPTMGEGWLSWWWWPWWHYQYVKYFNPIQIIRKHKRANNGGRPGLEELTGDRVLSPARGSLTRWYDGNFRGRYNYQVKNSLLEWFSPW